MKRPVPAFAVGDVVIVRGDRLATVTAALKGWESVYVEYEDGTTAFVHVARLDYLPDLSHLPEVTYA